MDIEFQKKWNGLQQKMKARFGEELDVQSILFIIGLQELGKNATKFTKDQKIEVMHVAVCSLLEPYGYYDFEGRDKDDWPHWTVSQKLPNLDTIQQEQLIKQSIVEYFEES